MGFDGTIEALLEETLKMVRRGEITGIAISVCYSDLCTGQAYKMDEASLAELLGCVTIMQARLVAKALAGSTEEASS